MTKKFSVLQRTAALLAALCLLAGLALPVCAEGAADALSVQNVETMQQGNDPNRPVSPGTPDNPVNPGNPDNPVAPGNPDNPVAPGRPDGNALPQSGQLNWPIPFMACSGVLLFAVGWVLDRKETLA